MSDKPTIEDSPLTCEDCLIVSVDVRPDICPYAEEINGTTVEIIICPSCYHERAMEI